jgi:hypothetical protein
MLFLQTLSFHIHTKNTRGWGGQRGKNVADGLSDSPLLETTGLAERARRLHSWAERVKDCAENQPEG